MPQNTVLVIGNRQTFEIYLQKARRLHVNTDHIKFVRNSFDLMGYDRDTQVIVLHGFSPELYKEAYDRFEPENIKEVMEL